MLASPHVTSPVVDSGPITVLIVISAGSAPGVAAGAALGASPTIAIVGNDTAGKITATAGASGAGTGVYATVTFSAAHSVAPRVVITAGSAGGTLYSPYISSVSTTTFVITLGGAASNGALIDFYYHVIA